MNLTTTFLYILFQQYFHHGAALNLKEHYLRNLIYYTELYKLCTTKCEKLKIRQQLWHDPHFTQPRFQDHKCFGILINLYVHFISASFPLWHILSMRILHMLISHGTKKGDKSNTTAKRNTQFNKLFS